MITVRIAAVDEDMVSTVTPHVAQPRLVAEYKVRDRPGISYQSATAAKPQMTLWVGQEGGVALRHLGGVSPVVLRKANHEEAPCRSQRYTPYKKTSASLASQRRFFWGSLPRCAEDVIRLIPVAR